MSKRWYGRKHDIVLFYTKTSHYTFNPQKEKSYLSHKYGFSNIEIHKDENGYYTLVGVRDVWNIPALRGNHPETTGYPTQKPLALLSRIIIGGSNEGDIVFDPFCGCATTLVAADRINRQWVGIDISSKAVELVKTRIKEDQKESEFLTWDKSVSRVQVSFISSITARNDIPQRTDIEVLRLYNSLDNKKHLYGQQDGNCNGCGEHFKIQHFDVDHIIAKAVGGTDHIENLQLLCSNCNRIKGDRGQEYLIAKLEGRRVKYA